MKGRHPISELVKKPQPHLRSFVLLNTILMIVTLALLVSGRAISQDIPESGYGTIKSIQKISSTQGNFTGTLDNSDNFGVSVCSIGDFDGDGNIDLVTGAYFDDDGGAANTGAVWVLFCDSLGKVLSHQKISASAGNFTATIDADDRFGISVEDLGDFDGDGNVDIIVGAAKDDDGGTDRGAAYVLFLNDTGAVKDYQKISDTEGNFTATLDDSDGFGARVANLGDVDGDGITDIAVSAYQDDDGGVNRGAVYVLFLNDTGAVKDYQKISDTQGNFTATFDNSDLFGAGLDVIGDLDLDGVNDLVVGAFYDDDKGANSGAVYVILLNDTGAVKSYNKISRFDWILDWAVYNGDLFGVGCTGIGDFDFDGIPDIAVGAIKDEGVRGAVWLIYLNRDGTMKNAKLIRRYHGDILKTLESDQMGVDICAPGDIDRDGVNDLVAGANLVDDGGADRGALIVFLMDKDPDDMIKAIKDQVKISDVHGGLATTLGNNDRFGSAIAGIGDLNNDGDVDIAVSAQDDDDGGTDTGAQYILFLDSTGNVIDEQKISATAGNFNATIDAGDKLGHAVTRLGRLKGDTLQGIVISAQGDDDGGTDRGAIYVLFLNDTGTVKDYQKISDTQGNFNATLTDSDLFGHSIDTIGDLDGDSNVELIVGAYGDDDGGTNRGAVYILFLNDTGAVKDYQKISDLKGGFTGTLDNDDQFGWSVAGIGDVNGDTIPDIAVGARLDDDGGSNNGAVWILFLNDTGAVKSHQKISELSGNLGNVLITGWAQFGRSVDGMGDVNFDGVPDILVGEANYRYPELSNGAVWVLTLDTTGTIQFKQRISEFHGGFQPILQRYGYFGTSAANIGDIDQDGYPDIGVGNYQDPDGGGSRGAAWILTFNPYPFPKNPLKTKQYAYLTKKLGSEYYRTYNEKLYFKYNEKYRAGDIDYTVYDEYHNAVTVSINLTKTFGENWKVLDLSTSGLTNNGFYTLEVKNDKGDMEKLRFKYGQ